MQDGQLFEIHKINDEYKIIKINDEKADDIII